MKEAVFGEAEVNAAGASTGVWIVIPSGVRGDGAVVTVSDVNMMETEEQIPSKSSTESDRYLVIAFLTFLAFIGNPSLRTSLSLLSRFRFWILCVTTFHSSLGKFFRNTHFLR